MENIILTQELLSDPNFIFTEEGSRVCEARYAEFLSSANQWFSEED